MSDWIGTILTALAALVGGALFGGLGNWAWSKKQTRTVAVPEPKKPVLEDDDVAEIREELSKQQELMNRVRDGGDPDAILDEIERRNARLDRELEQRLGKPSRS